MGVRNFKETAVYKKAFAQAMKIFEISKSFPKEETYSLTDQIRRASRSVCTNIADADMENTETSVWLDFAEACKYISTDLHKSLISENEEIGKLLNHMILNPEKY